MSLTQLIERSEGYDRFKADYGPEPVVQHRFHPATADLIVPAGMFGASVSLPLTDHALGQVCDRLGAVAWPGSSRSLPLDYLSTCPPDLRAENLNHWTGNAPLDRQWFVRGYGEHARAVLTNRFSVVDCTETLRWAQQIIEEKGGGGMEVFQSYLTPDVLHLKLLKCNVNPGGSGPYGVGVYIGTGEIGTTRIFSRPFGMKHSCTNSIWWKREGAWEHPHTGQFKTLRQEFLVHMHHALEGTESLLAAILDAENKTLPNFDEVIAGMCDRNGWGEEIKGDILKGAGTNETVGAVVDGVTWAAQRLEDGEAQIDMESVAGEFLWAMTRPERERAPLRPTRPELGHEFLARA